MPLPGYTRREASGSVASDGSNGILHVVEACMISTSGQWSGRVFLRDRRRIVWARCHEVRGRYGVENVSPVLPFLAGSRCH